MKKTTSNKAKICTLRIELKGSKPRIWRRIAIPGEATLGELHEAIQCVMPWDNYHLHEFQFGGKSCGDPNPEYEDDMLDEQCITLEEVFAGKRKRIEYIYDFGDGWEHSIECESIGPAEMDLDCYPVCLEGAMACPLEDSGALFGYYSKLEILKDPKHEEYEMIRDWMPPDFDPAAFDVEEANSLLKAGLFTDEDFEEAEEAMNMELSRVCAWCGKELGEDDPLITQSFKAGPDLELDELKGTFIMSQLGTDKRTVPVYVVPDNTPAKKDGHDMLIILCSDRCAEDLGVALADASA